MTSPRSLQLQSIAEATEALRATQLRQLQTVMGADEGSRMEVHYYPATCKTEIVIVNILTNQGDCAESLQTQEPETFLMLQGLLHQDHHTSYQDPKGRTIRVYHFPRPGEMRVPLPQPMMMLFAVGPSACEVTTADSNQIVSTKAAVPLVRDHLNAGGEVLWRDAPPEGDVAFWQSKMRRGLEP